jgi:hypothetical protein
VARWPALDRSMPGSCRRRVSRGAGVGSVHWRTLLSGWPLQAHGKRTTGLPGGLLEDFGEFS